MILLKMHSYSKHQSNTDFQNLYFRFMYAIKSPETKKRYQDRFKTFLDYVDIIGTTTEENYLTFIITQSKILNGFKVF